MAIKRGRAANYKRVKMTGLRARRLMRTLVERVSAGKKVRSALRVSKIGRKPRLLTARASLKRQRNLYFPEPARRAAREAAERKVAASQRYAKVVGDAAMKMAKKHTRRKAIQTAILGGLFAASAIKYVRDRRAAAARRSATGAATAG